jgi:mono/diheme cytochrome c family protein
MSIAAVACGGEVADPSDTDTEDPVDTVEPDPTAPRDPAEIVVPDQGSPPLGYADTPPASASDPACSTGQWWQFGDVESERMHPGGDCIGCHTDRRDGPRFTFAGTVMGDLADAQDCRGIEDVTVDIIDANGNLALTMHTNLVGNFYSQVSATAVTLPYTAEVTYDGRTRVMSTPQEDGDCMSCHTADGENGAPGRILLP